ncbi:MAG: aminotransferase class I/II-fold pyridoxal phosphate-dependent enzyme [archaeon YNP-WB-062]|nr:aminotransferase class I/II-fold pyridoxal phosphate-dependent enzyme [Candidatus Culexarchaeum yellowstonense]
MRIVDLRSDTVTIPPKEALATILEAPLGDDVYREDPTVNRLEAMAAEIFEKEAALLVTSGTQANLISVMAHTKRGDEVIVEYDSHIYNYEVGGMSWIAGVHPRPIKGVRGFMDPAAIEAAIRPKDIHCGETTLLCVENTHNRAGGTVITPKQMEAMAEVARRYGLKVYVDGARIFNAAVALGVKPSKLVEHADSLSFCLSKGLAGPVGSLMVGPKDFIERARKIRKVLGGGMRKAGVIAAPGIWVLEHMVDRLKEDHENARKLALGLSKIKEISIDLDSVQTNIVIFELKEISAKVFVEALAKRGVKCGAIGPRKIRMVTHYGITSEDIDYALKAVKAVIDDLSE